MKFLKEVSIVIASLMLFQNASAQCYTPNLVFYHSDVDGIAECVDDNASVPTPMLTVVNGALHSPTCSQGYVASNFQPSGIYNPAGPAVRLTVIPNPGYQLNIMSMSVNLKRAPVGGPEGPPSIRFAYSTDNGATWIDEGSNHFPVYDLYGCASAGLNHSWNMLDFSTPDTLLIQVFGLASPYPLGELYVKLFQVAGWVSTYGTWGCNDAAACNYDPDATGNDGSCTYEGCTDALACNYDAYSGCDDGSCHYIGDSCNDADESTTDDVWTDCITCQGTVVVDSPYSGYTVTEIPIPADVAASIDAALPVNGEGLPHCYQVRICLDDPYWELKTIYGGAGNPNWIMASTTSFYQHVFGGLMASEINPALFPFIPALEFDSWFTIGNGYGSSVSTAALPSSPGSALHTWNSSGLNLDEGSEVGSAIFGLWSNPDAQGMPDENNSILIAQVVTDGIFNAQFNFQFRKLNPDGTLYIPVTVLYETGVVIDGTPGVAPTSCAGFEVFGCTDALACNFLPDANTDDGSCTYPGCTNEFASNYDAASGCDNGSCIYTGCTGDFVPDGVINIADLLIFVSQYGDCTGGNCTADLNNDGAVNTSDFLIFSSVFGNTCTAPE